VRYHHFLKDRQQAVRQNNCVDNTKTTKMPVFYNPDKEEIHQYGQPSCGNNANFRNYRNPNNRNNSDTKASLTGHHIGGLFSRHRMNQAEAQNGACSRPTKPRARQ
jgi:hypothetical protein